LLEGYGGANKDAALRVKQLENLLKQKDAAVQETLQEERRAMQHELQRAVEAQHQRSDVSASKLRCADTRRNITSVENVLHWILHLHSTSY
jgi:ribosomal protein S6